MCPAQLQPFYFQCIPRNLICLNSTIQNKAQFKFFLFKDNQKYDASKAWFDSKFQNKKMTIENQKLQFFIHSFIEKHNVMFTLKLAQNYPTEKIIGNWNFFVNDYIQQYKRNNKNRFLQNIQICELYSLDIQFYLQTSKFYLQKAIKSYKNSNEKIFELVKPNQTLKQSIVKQEEQVEIYSKQLQNAKLQQFKLQQQQKQKQILLKKAKIKSQQEHIQKENKQMQKLNQKASNVSMFYNNKRLIIAIVICLFSIFILGSKYISEITPQTTIQVADSTISQGKKKNKKTQKKQKN